MRVVTQTNITAFPLLSRGKVRDIYDIDDKTLLIVTTDRMSAFDVIMSEPVPYKGAILNQITLFWMEKFQDIIPNHLVESDVSRFPACLAPWADELEGRAVLVRKARHRDFPPRQARHAHIHPHPGGSLIHNFGMNQPRQRF